MLKEKDYVMKRMHLFKQYLDLMIDRERNKRKGYFLHGESCLITLIMLFLSSPKPRFVGDVNGFIIK